MCTQPVATARHHLQTGLVEKGFQRGGLRLHGGSFSNQGREL
jgi:hypothetical protein